MLTFTYYGYAAVELHLQEKVLIDPGIVDGESLVDLDVVDPAVLLVTNPNIRHLGNAFDVIRRFGVKVIGNSEVASLLHEQGASQEDLVSLEVGESWSSEAGVTVTAYESAQSTLTSQNTTFYISSEKARVLHLGRATMYAYYGSEIPDLLCVPVAGEDEGTLNPEQAATITSALQPDYVLPICGDTTAATQFLLTVSTLAPKVTTLFPAKGQTYTIMIRR
jgi:L-ascorbate metabolism protein UlaG (beta-lactamase superfamily)